MNTASQSIPEHSAPRTGIWPGYAAALWSLIFAVFHVIWAAGWYVGLWPEEAYRRSFQRPGLWAFDVIVAGVCFLAVAVALALVQPWGRRVPRWLLGLLAWSGTGLLVLRAGGSVIQLVYFLVRGKFVLDPMLVWEVWFYLGTIFFVLSLRQYRRASQSA